MAVHAHGKKCKCLECAWSKHGDQWSQRCVYLDADGSLTLTLGSKVSGVGFSCRDFLISELAL